MLVMERVMARITFGDVVRRRREALGLSQGELAARIGWDATRVSKVETNQNYRRMPDAETFRMWAEALEMEPAVMLHQMGYIGEADVLDPERHPELVFTSLAEEIRQADVGAEVQEIALDGIRHARMLWEARKRGERQRS